MKKRHLVSADTYKVSDGGVIFLRANTPTASLSLLDDRLHANVQGTEDFIPVIFLIEAAEKPTRTRGLSSRSIQPLPAAYDERLYSFDGTEALTEQFDADRDPELWEGSFRLLFFFHYLNTDIPLSTPFGKFTLPIPTELPRRLVGMEYDDP